MPPRVAAFCGLLTPLTFTVGWLVGGYVHAVAQAASDGPQLLAPLGQFIGEPGFGPLTQTLFGGFEGVVFGTALAYGLTRRPASSNANDQRPTTSD